MTFVEMILSLKKNCWERCLVRALEFSDPEVAIGLSILSFRYQGMRINDVKRLVEHLHKLMSNDSGDLKKKAKLDYYKRKRKKRSIYSNGFTLAALKPEARLEIQVL